MLFINVLYPIVLNVLYTSSIYKVDVKQPGLFFAIPGIDRIAYCVDMRETAIVIPPQTTITKDNVSVRNSLRKCPLVGEN